MELSFQRTHEVAQVGTLPVAVWQVCDLSGDAHGLAMIAEIVPLPDVKSSVWTPQFMRDALRSELAQPDARMTLTPTGAFARTADTQARIWTGRTELRLPVAAFIPCLTPLDDPMNALMQRELSVLMQVRTEVVSDQVLDHLSKADLSGALR